MHKVAISLLLLLSVSARLQGAETYNAVIRNGMIYNGTGGKPFAGDVGIRGDKIAVIGNLSNATASVEIDAAGLAVAPGFINMLSWANESLLEDGRSQSDIRQGVTLEIMGEGDSIGPLNAKMKATQREGQGDIRYDIPWTTLGEYLEHLVQRGVSCNVASFVGTTTVRIHELGHADRPPTKEEMERMKELVRHAMREGALGVGSSLIYAPAFYAKTDELIELSKAAAEYDGMYISHLRSEGNTFLEAIDELIRISTEARVPAQIYHLKAAGKANWPKMTAAIEKIEAARRSGGRITADMYTYTAGATGLDAAMPPWVQEGGYAEWAKRLKEPETRARVLKEMVTPTDKWESLYLMAGSPDRVLLAGFKNEKLKPLTGKSLAEVAKLRGKSPEETAVDLVIEDGSRVSTIYFLMDEANVRRQIALPWVSFDSDEGSYSPDGVFLKSNPHPRAYGNFARLLGKYVRDEKLVPLEEAIRRLTSFPAQTLKLDRRGALRVGHYADVVVFDPQKIQDHATFEKPHQYSTGVRDVFVNGVQVLKESEHTGAKPGQVVRGPGWQRAAVPPPLPRAHAHNDYEHPRPLFDALEQGFLNVEADIYLVDGKLLVAHNLKDVKPDRTLQALYLDPLRNRARRNDGRVFPGGPEFTLMIDLKTAWTNTYPALRAALREYADMLTTFQEGKTKTNAVRIVISGNRALNMFDGEAVRYAAYDGNLTELSSAAGADLIPWISANWGANFTWTGTGTISDAERVRLKDIVAKAHDAGRRVRFWGAPDRPEFWKALNEASVDLINTDRLAELAEFLRASSQP